MDYTGLVFKYSVNRPLSDEERTDQLKQKQKRDVAPHYDLSIIKINNTFVESVDKFYSYRGMLTTFALWGSAFMSFMSASIIFGSPATSTKLIGIFMGLPTSFLWIFLLLKEVFSYTHFPLRFNRKNRTVYVFRTNGTVLKIKWDDVFFTFEKARTIFGPEWMVCGHVLDKDRNTVLETFPLAAYGGTEQEVLPIWEFYRRYMENGPQAALGELELICLPRLDQKRESFAFGWERLVLLGHGGWPLLRLAMLPIFTACAFGRWLSMRTSKIPQWPQWVEDECAVAPNDTFVRDRSTNAPDVRAA